MIHHLTIIGVGLIGGSVAKALRCENAVGHVTGFGRRESTLQRAQALGVIDTWSLDLDAAVERAEVVILASPVNSIASIFHELKPCLGEATIVTDAGSVKGSIVDAAVRGLGDKIVNFVPGHPIAGKEQSGIDAASETLFHGHRTILTPMANTGAEAISELDRQIEQTVNGKADEIKTKIYPHQIAFNALPFVESFAEGQYTTEEWKMVYETRKILHEPNLPVSATCVRVPVYNSHGESVNVELTEPMNPIRARDILSSSPGIVVQDDPEIDLYPLPINSSGTDDVFVGRIREDISHPNGLVLWVVADNLRKGAALNTIQIAEVIAG